jgi:hypothetical protein
MGHRFLPGALGSREGNEVFEQRPEPLVGAKQPRFDRPLRQLHDGRNLLVLQPVDVPQHDEDPPVQGQRGERAIDGLPPEQRLFQVAADCDFLERSNILRSIRKGHVPATAPVHLTARDVDSDAIQPGVERTVASKAPDASIRAHENVLNEIFHVAVTGRQRANETVYIVTVVIDELVKGFPAAQGSAGDERPIRIQSVAYWNQRQADR